MQVINRIVVWLARSPLHGFVSKSIAVVKYIGRRSHKCFAVPVNYVQIDDNGRARIWIMSQRDRVWWRNFVGGYRAEIVLRGQQFPVELIAVTDEQGVANDLKVYLQQAQNAAKYVGVGFGDDGQLRSADIERAAAERVMVYADLELETSN